MWQVTTIDEYDRLRAASVGGVAATWGYSATTNLLSQIKATGVQQYDYSFDGATGNLNSRQNSLRSLSETFGYDTEKLDRLTSVTGPSAQTIGYHTGNKGNKSFKSDVGIYDYDPAKKYRLNRIYNGVNISTTDQDISYTAFNKVQQISEGAKTAEFLYNADNQRIRMILKNNGSVTKTRWYFGGSCEREQVGSTVTQYIWIGGDAYTAVAVAKKTGTGSWVVYHIFRDHLGTITHLKNGSTIDEYSFDAWGRRRDKDNWSYTLSGEPALVADRGFTGHEYLEDFNLYNMNGRLYDPVVGRFLSPDPYIADPSFTQSYNRYSYVLNNPLKYNDPTGEFPWLAAGIFAAYMYLNNAHANRDQSTGKWAWNPTSWFGKGSNTTVVFGVKTNSDFTDATAFMGIGGNPFMPAFAVNSNSGVGFGVYTPQGTDFVYPGVKQQAEYSVAIEAINHARMNSAGAWRTATYGEIRPYQPSTWDAWYDRSQSNFISKVTYEIADAIWVTSQSLLIGPRARHISGSEVIGNERIDAFVNATEMGLGYTIAPIKSTKFSSGPSSGYIFRNELGNSLMYINRGRKSARYGYQYSFKWNENPVRGWKESWIHLFDW